jgi:hypothetical protein
MVKVILYGLPHPVKGFKGLSTQCKVFVTRLVFGLTGRAVQVLDINVNLGLG